jgi:hypothetical protein
MLIKRLAAGAALGLVLFAGACGDDDKDDDKDPAGDSGAGDAGDSGRPLTPGGDGGFDIDASTGLDGAVRDGSVGPDGSISADGSTPADGSTSTLPDGALADVDAATNGGGTGELDGAADAATGTTPDTGAGAGPDAGSCTVNSATFGCGREISPTWVRFDNGLEIDRATGIAWAPAVGTQNDGNLERECEKLNGSSEFGGLSGFGIPEMAEVRTLAQGCAKTVTGGSCPITAGLQDYSAAPSDCDCTGSAPGPYAGGGYCRPELATCETLWTATICEGSAECPSHEHWFYDVSTGSIVRAPYGSPLALSAKGRCSTTLSPELIP